MSRWRWLPWNRKWKNEFYRARFWLLSLALYWFDGEYNTFQCNYKWNPMWHQNTFYADEIPFFPYVALQPYGLISVGTIFFGNGHTIPVIAGVNGTDKKLVKQNGCHIVILVNSILYLAAIKEVPIWLHRYMKSVCNLSYPRASGFVWMESRAVPTRFN